ncbi:helix-turn-helix domain-containing protein [Synechococcus elongatus]|uniref:helix-turn-helix domain-containing protein n=1 Tax=Synechococcus elongatus TaxID=32046 RepID=UPI003CC87A39
MRWPKIICVGTVHAGLSPATVGKLCHSHFDQIDRSTVEKLCKFFKLESISGLLEIEGD